MRKIIAIMVFCLMGFSLFQGFTRVNSSNADEAYKWIPINNGLYGGDIYSFAFDPTNTQLIYAATLDSGVFKSVDGGGHWYQINTGLLCNAVMSLAIDSINTQTIYAGTYAYGLFKHTVSCSIITSAGPGGSVSPSGTVTVDYGDSRTFTITPNNGYKTSDVKVD
jgi:hypothetical protein